LELVWRSDEATCQELEILQDTKSRSINKLLPVLLSFMLATSLLLILRRLDNSVSGLDYDSAALPEFFHGTHASKMA
jgi:hypothetical protein